MNTNANSNTFYIRIHYTISGGRSVFPPILWTVLTSLRNITNHCVALQLFDFPPLCNFKCDLKLPAQVDAFVCLFSTIHFLMFLQCTCKRWCIITLVTFVWLHCVSSNVSSNGVHRQLHSYIGCICVIFSIVCFQMCPQIACLWRSIVTLVAFLLFFNVLFQMCPQTVCPRWSIVTLVAFVWFFSAMYFQMCPQIACPKIGIFIFDCIRLAFSSVCF